MQLTKTYRKERTENPTKTNVRYQKRKQQEKEAAEELKKSKTPDRTDYYGQWD